MSVGKGTSIVGMHFGQKKENWTFCELWKIMEALFVAEKLVKRRRIQMGAI